MSRWQRPTRLGLVGTPVLLTFGNQFLVGGKGQRDLDLLALHRHPAPRPPTSRRWRRPTRLGLVGTTWTAFTTCSARPVAKADATWTCWHTLDGQADKPRHRVAKADATWTCWHVLEWARHPKAVAGGKGRRDLDLLAPSIPSKRSPEPRGGKGRRDLDLLARVLMRAHEGIGGEWQRPTRLGLVGTGCGGPSSIFGSLVAKADATWTCWHP